MQLPFLSLACVECDVEMEDDVGWRAFLTVGDEDAEDAEDAV